MKIAIHITLLFVLGILNGFTQDTLTNPDKTEKTIVIDNQVYTYVAEWPEFPGGSVERNKFLSTHLTYPLDAEWQGIQGRVIVGFLVDKDGSIGDVKILKGVYPSLDKEALRVISMMPNWKPAKNEGVPVKTRHKVDIVYRLPSGAYLEKISCDSQLVKRGTLPVFENGKHLALQQFIVNNIQYPKPALNAREQGKISIDFTVDKNNQVKDVFLTHGVSSSLNVEALRVVQKLHNWKAGTLGGEPIDVKYSIDILFQL